MHSPPPLLPPSPPPMAPFELTGAATAAAVTTAAIGGAGKESELRGEHEKEEMSPRENRCTCAAIVIRAHIYALECEHDDKTSNCYDNDDVDSRGNNDHNIAARHR